MPSVRVRKETGNLFFEFRYQGLRCREQSALPDSPQNRKRMEQALQRIEAEIGAGTFEYSRHFPNSKMLPQIRAIAPAPMAALSSLPMPAVVKCRADAPLISEFAEVWFSEMQVGWRKATRELNRYIIDRYIGPRLGLRKVNELNRAEVMAFRAAVVVPTPEETRKEPRSASTVNHIMGVLRMLMGEAAQRYDFPDPTLGVKRLKVKKTDVNPFTLDEVKAFLNAVREDFRNYYTVRFFTGMRTGEVHGLKWINVDFEARFTASNGSMSTLSADSSRSVKPMVRAGPNTPKTTSPSGTSR